MSWNVTQLFVIPCFILTFGLFMAVKSYLMSNEQHSIISIVITVGLIAIFIIIFFGALIHLYKRRNLPDN